MRSPIQWFGGKGRMTAKLIPILEGIPHTRYVEPFGGGASVLLAKRPVEVETYNDLDAGLHTFFSVLADPDLFEAFYRHVALLPYSRRLYDECCAGWRGERNRVKAAAMWYVVARQSFSGRFESSWGSVVTTSRRGMVGTVSNWLSALDGLPEVHRRLQRVQIENADWRVVLARYDTPDTLFYCDPPYATETRGDKRYDCEMTMSNHAELVAALLRIQGKAVLSGYAHAVYAPLSAAGWTRQDWQTACHAAARTRATGIQGDGAALRMQPRTESVWLSPGASAQMLMPLLSSEPSEDTGDSDVPD